MKVKARRFLCQIKMLKRNALRRLGSDPRCIGNWLHSKESILGHFEVSQSLLFCVPYFSWNTDFFLSASNFRSRFRPDPFQRVFSS